MNTDELLELGVSTDIQTACKALGISKSGGYTLARKGDFPCRVIMVGQRFVVPTAGLLEVLGIKRPDPEAGEER